MPRPLPGYWRIHRTSPCGIRLDSLRAPTIARIDDRHGAEAVARANPAINALSPPRKHETSPFTTSQACLGAASGADSASTSTRSALFTRNAPRNRESVMHAGQAPPGMRGDTSAGLRETENPTHCCRWRPIPGSERYRVMVTAPVASHHRVDRHWRRG